MKTKITPVDSLRMAHLKKISGTPDRADRGILRGRPLRLQLGRISKTATTWRRLDRIIG
ncbi:MAG: hypothetical protein O6938_10225 [Gammaproteobacteria bacterium]|nr:hypothetical protein [Gammaproteobacteria bacterium]